MAGSTKKARSELRLLREIGWFFLANATCYFCRHSLLPKGEHPTFGHRRHKALSIKLTFHHLNGDRNDNRPYMNVVPCHRLCHIRYHANKRKEELEREEAHESSSK